MELGFVHFNNDARSKMMRLLQIIRDQQAIDELGLGRVRDAFSNMMFPGLSSLHQHAKYFILIPQIYREAERYNYNDIRDVHAKIIELEIKLTQQLIAGSPSTITGITGSDVVKRSGSANRDKYVKYDPAYIYGGGLRTFDIVKTRNPEQLIFARSKMREANPTAYKSEDEGASDDNASLNNTEYLVLPNESFSIRESERSIFLNPVEGNFLKEHITEASDSKNSLLAYILNNDVEVGDDREFVKVQSGQHYNMSFNEFSETQLPEPFRNQAALAKAFSRFALPLNIRYMVIYHQIHGATDAAEEANATFEQYFNAAMEVYNKDLIHRVFSFVDIHDAVTENFCLKAIDYAKHGYDTKDYSQFDNLIMKREQAVKGEKRCKLRPEYEYDADYSKNVYPMDFRWTRVVRIVNEIRKGIEGWQPRR